MPNQQRTSTSTQIRNMYSDGLSCLNLKFYNTNLSLQLYPFSGKDQNGRSSYDNKSGVMTTVNFEGAFALYQAAKDIVDGKVQQCSLTIPCNGANVIFERKLAMNGVMETTLSISKNNVTIPFKFNTIQQQVNLNGQMQTYTVESGLGAFMKTVEGYLTGINADRHLDKMTEEYAKLQESNSNGQQQNQQQQRPQYANNNNRKRYNNGGNSYGNNSYQRPQQNYTAQNFSDYSIGN